MSKIPDTLPQTLALVHTDFVVSKGSVKGTDFAPQRMDYTAYDLLLLISCLPNAREPTCVIHKQKVTASLLNR